MKNNNKVSGVFLRPVLALAGVLALGLPTVFGWGSEGHQAVAVIAEARLTPAAKAQVTELLEGKSMSDSAIPVWADVMAPKSTKPWHYVDIPSTDDKYVPERDGNSGNNVIDKTVELAAVLRDKTKPVEERRRALKYLIHFLGDIHQPLHCVERKNDDGKPDRGGNLVEVKLPEKDAPEKLHLAWDVDLLKDAMGQGDVRVFAHGLDKAVTPEEVKTWTQGMAPGADGELPQAAVLGWALESHKIAVETVYPGIPTDGSVVTLDKAYMDKSAEVIRARLKQGGVRLAQLLNQELK